MARFHTTPVRRPSRRRAVTPMTLSLSLLAVLSLMSLWHASNLLNVRRAPVEEEAGDEGLAETKAAAERARAASGQRCVHPALDPHHPSVTQFFLPQPPVDCSAAMSDWVFVANGTFRISARARRLYGAITCRLAPLVRVDDFTVRHGPHAFPARDGTRLTSDFFTADCMSASGRRYFNVHSAVAWNEAVHTRLKDFQTRGAPRMGLGRSQAADMTRVNLGTSQTGDLTHVGLGTSQTGSMIGVGLGTSQTGDLTRVGLDTSQTGSMIGVGLGTSRAEGMINVDQQSNHSGNEDHLATPPNEMTRSLPSKSRATMSVRISRPHLNILSTVHVAKKHLDTSSTSTSDSEVKWETSALKIEKSNTPFLLGTKSKHGFAMSPNTSVSEYSSDVSRHVSKSHVHALKETSDTKSKAATASKQEPKADSHQQQRKPQRAETERPRAVTASRGDSLHLSVFMFGFDSLSRQAWERLLPGTRRYLLQELGAVELQGYNVLGDGTPAALLPLLTGRTEEELPEARRGVQGSSTLDLHPWLWKDFSRHGYVTAHAEDMSHVGTFQLRMLGFKEQPTDHSLRPFYSVAERLYGVNPPLCLGSTPRHLNFMNWFRELFRVYRPYPKFFFGFHSEMSHDDNNKVQALDRDLVTFLRDLHAQGHLDSTLLVLMADHGARYDYIRATAQGKLEERMPYFALRFPPWFGKQYPDLVKNVKVNAWRLTTPFDIHETFMDLLHFSGTGMGDLAQRGISLFQEIPKQRTCSQAGITPHWCACLEWQPVNQSDALVARAVQSALDSINGYTVTQRHQCARLNLQRITHSARYVPSETDRSAEQRTAKYSRGRAMNKPFTAPAQGPAKPSSSSSSAANMELYQVSFLTRPGHAHFEVTCSRDVTSGRFSVSMADVSRINRYGSQPACIMTSLPHLRPYCICV